MDVVPPNPDGQNSGQPSVVGDTVYIGWRDAKEYALDAATGVTKWPFDATTVPGPLRGSAADPLRDAPAIGGDRAAMAC